MVQMKTLRDVKTRVIMHVDLDYFYAQCEERENPSLKGKPVVVCVYSGRGPHSGVVSAANYPARSYDVKAGMPISTAERILKDHDSSFLPVRHELYDAVSESIMEILRGYGDSFEQVSVDEAFLDVTKRTDGDFGRADSLASEIKGAVMAKETLTCSIGVGPNKLLAKIASEFRKPNGLTVVRPEEMKTFLYPLPVGKLYGVGRKTEAKMEELGIKTVRDLTEFSIPRLIDVFGKKLGVYFHRAANGIDEEPVQEREGMEQISRIATLKENTREPSLILHELNRLSEDVRARVVRQGLDFTSVGIIGIMEDLSTHTKTRTLATPTDDLDVIRSVVKKLLEALLSEIHELDMRRVGVRVSGLTKKGGQQPLHEFLGG